MKKTNMSIEKTLRIERSMRKEMRQMSSLLKEQGGVKEAFKDVFRALRLVAMDFGNVLRLAVGMLITFNPEKIKEKIRAFDERRQKINAEWAPIVNRAKDAIGSADPILSMAIIGPANYFALQGMGAGLVAGKTVAEVVTATNWDSLINSFTVTLDVNQSLQQFFQNYTRNEESRREREEEFNILSGKTTRGNSIMNRLSNLFSESTDPQDAVLLEQAAAPKMTEKQAIDMFVKATGMDKKFKELLDAHKENLKNTLQPIASELEPMVAVSNMFSATNLKEFNAAVKQAKSINPKLNEEPFVKFDKQVQEETKKFADNPKAVEDLKKKLSVTQATPEALNAEIEKIVFNTLKSEFDKKVAAAIKSARDNAKIAIDDLKIDSRTLQYMQDSTDSEIKQLAEIYKNLSKTYDTINRDFENKAKSKVA